MDRTSASRLLSSEAIVHARKSPPDCDTVRPPRGGLARPDVLRPSGVRSAAERVEPERVEPEPVEPERVERVELERVPIDAVDANDASEQPTLPPPPSLRDVRDTSAPLEELLYRFEVGDHKGALAAAESLLDRRLVPTLVVSWDTIPRLGLSPDAVLLLTSVDGQLALESLLEACGVPMLDAIRALCDLLDRRVITLR